MSYFRGQTVFVTGATSGLGLEMSKQLVVGGENVAEVSFDYLKRNKGQFMLLAAVSGLIPNHSYSAYAASKFASVGLVEVLRYEWKPFCVDVKLACPPTVMTPMVEQELKESPKESQVLKAFSGYLDIEFACRYMLHGLSKRSFYIVPGFKIKAVLWLQRLFPSINRFIADRVIGFYHKRSSR
ncbi:MAG: SDR family NAD(P)-dependent oxidoreductase [Pseudomonadota bacterium]